MSDEGKKNTSRSAETTDRSGSDSSVRGDIDGSKVPSKLTREQMLNPLANENSTPILPMATTDCSTGMYQPPKLTDDQMSSLPAANRERYLDPIPSYQEARKIFFDKKGTFKKN